MIAIGVFCGQVVTPISKINRRKRLDRLPVMSRAVDDIKFEQLGHEADLVENGKGNW